jgi:two-component system sensor histidine kinase KdpD
MAPGVGKTYKMLEEAHRRVSRGADLVVGYVEPHGRVHTADLLEGLETLPRDRMEHRGIVVEEMSTDAVLERQPAIALIDELAHTNVPGSARDKRWQDIDLIREAGIDVITTCNVQHLESAADAVATIIGAPVIERLPDEILADADEVELVDMSPRALRQRMRHGNVYSPERTEVALDRFFTEANLTALREIALRIVADQVDDQLVDIGSDQLDGPSSIGGRVAVALDDTTTSRSALRRGANLASALRIPLVAIVVETPLSERRALRHDRDLSENVEFAVDLGAEVMRVSAAQPAAGLTAALRRRQATHLLLPYRAARTVGGFRRPSIAEVVLRELPTVEVHLVADDPPKGGRGSE